MRGRGAAGFVLMFIVVAAIVAAALGPPGLGVAAEGDVIQAGWGDGEWSPLGLIIGVIVLFLVLKVLFRLAAGPRWYGGPWSWGHGHAGWHGGGRGEASEAFRRWHDQAHGSVAGSDDAQPPASSASDQPSQPSGPGTAPQGPARQVSTPQGSQPGQAPQWPYPGQAPQGPYSGQGPQAPYGGQAPQGPYPGQAPEWSAPGQQAPWPAQGQQPQWPYPPPPPTGPDR